MPSGSSVASRCTGPSGWGLRKLVHAKWLDDLKATAEDPDAVRSQLVATEINTYVREDDSQSTPSLLSSRLIVALAASKSGAAGSSAASRDRFIARYDIRVAFFHAPSAGQIAVVPPPGLSPPGIVRFLEKAMYGTSEASKCLGEQVVKVMTGNGFEEALVVPMTSYEPKEDVTSNCHGDDFLAEGTSAHLDVLDGILRANFDTKILPRIGPPGVGGAVTSGKHLGRTISWKPEGFTWDGGQGHVEDLHRLLGLTATSKGCSTPASKDTGKAMRNALDHLDEERTTVFRRAAGPGLYISLDRPSIQFAMHDVMAGMQEPTELHWARLVRVARYLLEYPKETWMYVYQAFPKNLEVLTDADWAADKESRRSVSCSAERFGQHLLEVSVAKQSVVALSSGESEFYGIVRVCAHGIQTQQLLGAVGVPVGLDILSDSSAAPVACATAQAAAARCGI